MRLEATCSEAVILTSRCKSASLRRPWTLPVAPATASRPVAARRMDMKRIFGCAEGVVVGIFKNERGWRRNLSMGIGMVR